MAKKKMTRGKKWLIVLAVLALAAAIVVTVILCIPKKVSKVTDATRDMQQSMFLSNKDDKAKFDSFKVKLSSTSAQYSLEINNASRIIALYSKMTSFYNEKLVFAEDNKTYQNNYFTVLDGFDGARKAETEMRSVLKQVSEYTGADPTFVNPAWVRFKEKFEVYVNNFNGALKGLANIYTACMPSKIANNDFAKVVLSTSCDYLSQLNVEKTHVITNAELFVNAYMNGSSPISKYHLSENLQSGTKKLNEFLKIYNLKNFEAVIAKSSASGFNYSKINADSTDLLNNVVKVYLRGGLGA